MTGWLLGVVILLPVAGAVVALVAAHQAARLAALGAVVTTTAAWAGALALGVAHWGRGADAAVVELGRVETGGIAIDVALRVDQLTASMLVLATTVALAVQVYSVAYLRGDPRYPSYAALVSIFTTAMLVVVAADDLFVLLVGWEVMGACSYLLISHHWELPEARAGAVKAFVMTRLGDVGLLFGIFVVGDEVGSYRISAILDAVAAGGIPTKTATVATLLLLCGVVGKSAQFPLHSWLPDAMPGPTPISALIHAATMVAAGVFLVARLLPLFELSTVTMNVLAVIASVTMLGSALFALAADDLKRVLAWSTVSQLAYMFAALAIGGYAVGVLHLLSHGAFKALLFLAAGSVIHAVGTQRLPDMGGLRKALPVTFLTMTVGFAALAGVPPFVGFFSKDAVLGMAYDDAVHQGSSRAWLLLVAGLVTAALTAAYSMRAWLLVFFGPRRGGVEAAVHKSSWLMLGPMVALAVPTAVGGVVVVRPAFLGVEAEPLNGPVIALSVAILVASVVFTWTEWARLERRDPARSLGRLRPALAREFRYDDLVDVGLARPTFLAARLTATAEDQVVDTYVAGTDSGAQWGGRLLRWLHDGNVQRYVTAVVLGAVTVALIVGMTQ